MKLQSSLLRQIRYYSTGKPSRWSDFKNKNFETQEKTQQYLEIDPHVLPRVSNTQTVYEPYDFSLKAKYANHNKEHIAALYPKQKDIFAELHLDPVELWKSPNLLNKYITQNGKIIPGWVNKLKGPSQKRVAKAIRRCRAAGLLSTVQSSVFRDSPYRSYS